MRRTTSVKETFRLSNSDIVGAAQDTRVYLGRERPSHNGRPLGAQPQQKFASAAPKQLPTAEVLQGRLTGSIVDDSDPGEQDSMNAVVQAALLCKPLNGPITRRDIPISPASHDNTQLEWGRPGVPLCAMGPNMCVAALLEGSLGPLGRYLTVAEQKQHNESPSELDDGYCLLCIRKQANLVRMSSKVAGSQDLATYIPPPCQNLVNCHEGYNECDIGALIPTADGDARIAGISDNMTVAYRVNGTGDATWYIDQSCMLYGQNPT